MKKRRFVLRTISKAGTVRIFGRTFRPDLDAKKFAGQRAAFGLYWVGDDWDSGFVSLWGSEAMYRACGVWIDDHGACEHLYPGPFCEDGVFKWEWWHNAPPQS